MKKSHIEAFSTRNKMCNAIGLKSKWAHTIKTIMTVAADIIITPNRKARLSSRSNGDGCTDRSRSIGVGAIDSERVV